MNESKWSAVKFIAAPLALGLAYLWGAVYYDTRMSEWGFRSHTFKLSVYETYVQTVIAAMSVVGRPAAYFNAVPTWSIVTVVLITLALGGGIGWLVHSHKSRVVSRQRRRAARSPRAASWRSVVTGALSAFAAVAAIPYAIAAVGLLLVIGVAPPLFAARGDALRDWNNRTFELWNQATWTTDTGDRRRGYVHSCSERECALLDIEGRAYLLPIERVGDRSGGKRSPAAPLAPIGDGSPQADQSAAREGPAA